MGRRGPPKKPDALKHPAKRKREHPPAAVIPSGEIPPRPPGLDPQAAAEWDRLTPICHSRGLLTEADTVAWHLLFAEYSDWLRMQAETDGAQLLEPNGNGISGPNPVYKMKHATAANLLKCLREFGLTPAARAGLNIKITGTDEQDPLRILEMSREAV